MVVPTCVIVTLYCSSVRLFPSETVIDFAYNKIGSLIFLFFLLGGGYDSFRTGVMVAFVFLMRQ